MQVDTDEALFKDSQIKREDLAAKLGTNRTYLADAIKQCTDGLTFYGISESFSFTSCCYIA